MNIEFSTINLQYLLKVRDLARINPELASVFLGLPKELVEVFSNLSAEKVASITKIKMPLLIARGDSWWWSRLFKALDERREDEIDAVLEQANLSFVL